MDYLVMAEVARLEQELHKEHERYKKRLFNSLLMPRLSKCPICTEVTSMNHEDEVRAINLADAAGRASNNGLHALADKLNKQAMRLLDGATAIPAEFSRHVYANRGYQDEQGSVLRDLYEGTVVYIQRSRP